MSLITPDRPRVCSGVHHGAIQVTALLATGSKNSTIFVGTSNGTVLVISNEGVPGSAARCGSRLD